MDFSDNYEPDVSDLMRMESKRSTPVVGGPRDGVSTDHDPRTIKEGSTWTGIHEYYNGAPVVGEYRFYEGAWRDYRRMTWEEYFETFKRRPFLVRALEVAAHVLPPRSSVAEADPSAYWGA